MKNMIAINSTTLAVKEYKGQRVVTLKDISEVHQQAEKAIRQNFHNNKKYFEKDVDFFLLRGKGDTKNFSTASNVTNLNVFTESGYLKLTKSLNDDLSWQVMGLLINSYFRVTEHQGSSRVQVSSKREKENNQAMLENIIPLMDPQFQKIIFYRNLGLTQRETAKLLDMSHSVIQNIETRLKMAGLNLTRQSRRMEMLVKTPVSLKVLNGDQPNLPFEEV